MLCNFHIKSHKITAYGYFRVPCLPPQTKEGQLSFKVQQIAQVWEYGSRAGCLSNSQLILAITYKSCIYSVELKTKIAPAASSNLVLTHRLNKEILVDLQTLPPALSQTC